MNFIQKYLLPKEIDFNSALQQQMAVSKTAVIHLCQYCQQNEADVLHLILENEQQSRKLRRKNVQDILSVFITPYDKEAIYRIIIQLDWIVMSSQHLAHDLLAYKIQCPPQYQPIFTALTTMIEALNQAFGDLPLKQLEKILKQVDLIHDSYDEAVKSCTLVAAKQLEEEEIKRYLAHKEILNQLKELARRIHISANYLEDLAMKIV